MRVAGRLARLEARLPDPTSEEREAEFWRQVSILDALEKEISTVPLVRRPMKDWPEDLQAAVIRRAVPRGLLEHGLPGEEVEDLAPAYVEMFSEGLKGGAS